MVQNIREKMATGLFWTFSQQSITISLNFLISVILARLMLPAQFGLLGMVAIFVSVGEVLMNGGLVASLIRKEQPDETDYSTVFFVNLMVSVLIYILVYFSAPLVAAFFKQPVLTSVLRVYMVTVIFYAFAAVPVTRLTKNMDFKRLALYHVPSLVIGGLTGVILASKGYGVWSLVYMGLVQAFLYSLLIWVMSGWTPAFVFHMDRFRQHFTFGSRLVLSLILDRVYVNAYNLVIGRFYSASDLGYYTRSSTLAQIPSENLYEALNKVSYPAFSSIQNEKERFVTAYKRIMQQSLFVIVPILSMMAITATPLFRLLLTAKWLPAVPYFRILCVAAVFNTVNGHSLTILLVKGRSDLFLKLNVIEKVLITAGIFTVISFGVFGLLYIQVVAAAVIYFFNGYTCGKLIDYPISRQITDILPGLLISLVVGGLTFLLGRLVYPYALGDFWRIALLCAVYSCLYILGFTIFKATEIKEFRDVLKNLTHV